MFNAFGRRQDIVDVNSQDFCFGYTWDRISMGYDYYSTLYPETCHSVIWTLELQVWSNFWITDNHIMFLFTIERSGSHRC